MRICCRETLGSITSIVSVFILKSPTNPAEMIYGKSLLVTEHPKVRNSTPGVPALLTTQRELLQKKLQQLLLLFLRKLQLFLCQFGEPSLPHAVSALFTVVETGAPPFILYKNIVNLNKSVNQNAVD